MRARRHRGGALPLARVFAIVVGLHAAVGAGALWLAKTQAGREFAKQYNLKFFDPPKPPEVAKVEPPPPPPPAPKIEQPKTPEVPKVAAPSAPTTAAAAPTIGGAASGGTNWNGKFSGAGFDGPEGAFHANVLGRLRKHYDEPPDAFGAAELEFVVTSSGDVRGHRLVKSSGNARNDQAILDAAARIEAEGLPAPPGGKGRTVTVRFVPSS